MTKAQTRRVAPRIVGLAATFAVVLCAAFGVGAIRAAASDASPVALTVIVDRVGDRVELYVGGGAVDVFALFGSDGREIVGPGGVVPFDALRLGTADLADALVGRASAQADGSAVRFEAMSMMVHPAQDAPRFETPLDGLIAIAVCTVPDPDQPPRLADLDAYAGFIAYDVDPSVPVSFSPPLGAAPIEGALRIRLIEHRDGRRLSDRTFDAPVGRPLSLLLSLTSTGRGAV